jgi:hypothetical protein
VVKRIPLGGKLGKGRFALVDDEDYELVSGYRWVLLTPRKGGKPPYTAYVQAHVPGSGRGGRIILMHVLLMRQRGVDHVNGDGLDNTRANLRLASRSQNGMNQRKQAGTSSRYKGVSWHRRLGRWQAHITTTSQRCQHLGYFSDEETAARAYDTAAREAFGAYARLNFP